MLALDFDFRQSKIATARPPVVTANCKVGFDSAKSMLALQASPRFYRVRKFLQEENLPVFFRNRSGVQDQRIVRVRLTCCSFPAANAGARLSASFDVRRAATTIW
jgi:hypothetical protein